MNSSRLFCFLLCNILITVDFSIGKPATHENDGPCDNPLDCLHGVLMHGDDAQGDSHADEDNYLRLKPALDTAKRPKSGPQEADEMLHGILMHGDDVIGKEHAEDQEKEEIKPDIPRKMETEDMMDYMHGVLMHDDSAPGHDHSQEHRKTATQDRHGNIQPEDADNFMHGVLMHGDANFKHEDEGSKGQEGEGVMRGPQDLGERMHDLMHNGEHVNHEQEAGSQKQNLENVGNLKAGPRSDDLHTKLMHADGQDIDHSQLHKDNKPFRLDMNDIESLRDLNIDPEILKVAGVHNLVKDIREYNQWKDQNKEALLSGSSLRFVSDSVLSDLEMMKQRYLERARQLESNGEGVTNEEALSVLRKTSAHEHDGDDSRHDLELIGSTVPLNDRHKLLRKQKTQERQKSLIGSTAPLKRN